MKLMKTVTTALFIMMASVIPAITVFAASPGETVSQNTTADLQAIDYETNETIGQLLAPSRYSMSDITNKKLEIFNQTGRPFNSITDEEAIRELNQDNLKIMSFEESFSEVQAQIGEIIQRVVDTTTDSETKGADFYTNKILQNKEKLLLGLAYLDRLYDFNMGEHNIRDALLYESKPYMYGQVEDVIDWLIYIGGSGGESLKISNNANVFGYAKPFWPVVTSAGTLDAFLEEYRQKFMPDTSMDEWLLQESPAYILEKSSDWDDKNTGLYRRLYDDAATRAHILPLLTVSEDSIYVIANSATITYGIVDCYIDRNLKETDPVHYGELREEFKQQLEQAASQQKSFIDVWHRIAKPEKQGLLSSNRLVLDSLRIDPDTTVQWSEKIGENAALGVKEFFTPLNLYGSYMFADGVAEGERIRYYVSKALTERGFATYAHESTHILVSDLMLNGYGSRDGMLAEVYTRGMFEPYEINDPPAFNLNLIYNRQAVSDRYHNGTPERFEDETGLQTYMSGILDVVYTLDYAEADVMFTKSTEEKMKWFHKLEQTEDPSERHNQGAEGSVHYLDSVRTLTVDEAESLNTIDDLIRNSIIVSRYEVNGTQTTGTMAKNGYYVVPLFSANYAGVQNDSGVSGDVMIRRQAFELLAEYGYYGGMVPYISNQYKESATADQTILSDQYILNKIFGSSYETMADFKKAMFQRRIDKVNELKPITITWKDQSIKIHNFEELRLLMKEAIESDLINVNVMPGGYNNIRAQATEVERLKQEIFKAYLIQTEDFRESIYGSDTEQPDTPDTPGDNEQPDKPNVSGDNGTEQPDTPDTPDTPGDNEQPDTPDTPDTPGDNEQPDIPDTPDTPVTPVTPGENEQPDTSDKPDTETGKPNTETGKPNTETGKPNTNTGKPNTGIVEKDITPSLFLCTVSSARTSNTIRWNSVKSADGYKIYGAKSNGKFKCLGTVGKKPSKWTHKKLKKGTQYKYYIIAYKKVGNKQVTIAKSLTVYSTTKNGKYGNPSKITVRKKSISVNSGKKIQLRVKVTGKSISKTGKKVRYVSSDPSVATVSKTGKITGKKRGSCTVYCIAQNGLYKKVKVTVSC